MRWQDIGRKRCEEAWASGSAATRGAAWLRALAISASRCGGVSRSASARSSTVLLRGWRRTPRSSMPTASRLSPARAAQRLLGQACLGSIGVKQVTERRSPLHHSSRASSTQARAGRPGALIGDRTACHGIVRHRQVVLTRWCGAACLRAGCSVTRWPSQPPSALGASSTYARTRTAAPRPRSARLSQRVMPAQGTRQARQTGSTPQPLQLVRPLQLAPSNRLR